MFEFTRTWVTRSRSWPARRLYGGMIWGLLIGLLPWLAYAAVDPLSYRERGSRHEGIKSKPVGGHDVELLAAMIEPEGPQPAALPDRLVVHFFLAQADEVHLTVRERQPQTYYWLDQVKPTKPWQAKVVNSFDWPSQDVLAPLQLKPAQLLVVARLGKATPPSRQERVAPVLFHPAAGPRQINAYHFVFKLQAAAKVSWSILGPANQVLAQGGDPIRRPADLPFDVLWRAGQQAEGTYRLQLHGYFLNDNVKFTQEVAFFHTPSWP